jgi:RHS repeat-associated protein
MDYRYQYDKAGNIVQRQTEEGIYQYGHDTLDRLTRAIPPTSLQQSEVNPNGLPIEGYSYDAVHNRIASQHQPGSWNYNQNNQLLQWGTDNDKTSYTYNKLEHTEQETAIQNGITAKQRSYYYDAAERLTEVKENGTPIAQYHYDPFGRRISKTVNGQTTYFQYSDEGLIAEYTGTGTQTVVYGYWPEGNWQTHPLYKWESNNYYYYHNDHLGTPQRLTNQQGKISWMGEYEAFGVIKETITQIQNPHRFPGQYHDTETNLYQNYYRDYNPTTGRYIERDPIGLDGGINVYVYTQSRPIVFSDFLGLSTEEQCDPSPPDCQDKCLMDNYGGMYDTAMSALPFTSVGAGVATAVTGGFSRAVGRAGERARVRAAYEDVRGGGRAFYAPGNSSRRIGRMLGGLRAAGALSGVIAAGAFGFAIGANVYCLIYCYKESQGE